MTKKAAYVLFIVAMICGLVWLKEWSFETRCRATQTEWQMGG